MCTAREREVLHLLVEGLSQKEIAARLHISVGYVKWYLAHARSEWGARSTAQLMYWIGREEHNHEDHVT